MQTGISSRQRTCFWKNNCCHGCGSSLGLLWFRVSGVLSAKHLWSRWKGPVLTESSKDPTVVAAEEERHNADACDHGANTVDSRAGVALPNLQWWVRGMVGLGSDPESLGCISVESQGKQGLTGEPYSCVPVDSKLKWKRPHCSPKLSEGAAVFVSGWTRQHLGRGLLLKPWIACDPLATLWSGWKSDRGSGKKCLQCQGQGQALWITMQDTGRTRGSLLVDPWQSVW